MNERYRLWRHGRELEPATQIELIDRHAHGQLEGVLARPETGGGWKPAVDLFAERRPARTANSGRWTATGLITTAVLALFGMVANSGNDLPVRFQIVVAIAAFLFVPVILASRRRPRLPRYTQ